MTKEHQHDAFWPSRLRRVLQTDACVMVTVISVRGSAPRSPGSRMIITPDGQQGSIGGGNLEFTATKAARELLDRSECTNQHTSTYGLGPSLNQCCGGAVELLFEHYPSGEHEWLERLNETRQSGGSAVLLTAINAGEDTKWVIGPGETLPEGIPAGLEKPINSMAHNTGPESPEGFTVIENNGAQFLLEPCYDQRVSLYLFGAGHVASALVRVLEQHAIRITWCDQREAQFPKHVPGNVEKVLSPDPVAIALKAEPGAHYLVMTHSHELDEDLCYAILNRADYAWLGLIGSKSKRNRFEHRLTRRGIGPEKLNSLTCPVGIAGIKGKRPATIALSIASQLLMEIVPETWR